MTATYTKSNTTNSFLEAFVTAVIKFELGSLCAGITSFCLGSLPSPKHLQNHRNKILLLLGKPCTLVATFESWANSEAASMLCSPKIFLGILPTGMGEMNDSWTRLCLFWRVPKDWRWERQKCFKCNSNRALRSCCFQENCYHEACWDCHLPVAKEEFNVYVVLWILHNGFDESAHPPHPPKKKKLT